jgi:hypothetical protein
MRDRRVRLIFVVLVLAFPMGIDAVSVSMERQTEADPARASARAALDPVSSWWVHGTQGVLLVGLTLAGRERKRLEARFAKAAR